MARTTKIITLSLPPEMAAQIEKLRKEEGRTRSELLREALRRCAEEREWRSGKDPGFSPASLLQKIRRTSRYSQAELDLLDFDGRVPDAARLGSRWHAMLREARAICDTLPAETAGTCVCLGSEELCTASSRDLPALLQEGRLRFHAGTIGGAWPHFPAG